MPNITIDSTGEVFEVDSDTDLLTILREKNLYIKSSCGGHASCSDCVMKVVSGEDNMNTPSFDEVKLLGNVFHITKERLACQVKLHGDVRIDLSMHDLSADQNRIVQKTSKQKGTFKVRKSNEVEKIMTERKERVQQKREKSKSWERHWEKDDDKDRRSRKLGGNKRPKKV